MPNIVSRHPEFVVIAHLRTPCLHSTNAYDPGTTTGRYSRVSSGRQPRRRSRDRYPYEDVVTMIVPARHISHQCLQRMSVAPHELINSLSSTMFASDVLPASRASGLRLSASCSMASAATSRSISACQSALTATASQSDATPSQAHPFQHDHPLRTVSWSSWKPQESHRSADDS